jgi:hypothetical protein
LGKGIASEHGYLGLGSKNSPGTKTSHCKDPSTRTDLCILARKKMNEFWLDRVKKWQSYRKRNFKKYLFQGNASYLDVHKDFQFFSEKGRKSKWSLMK